MSPDNARTEIDQIRWDAFAQTPTRAHCLALCDLNPGRNADFYQRYTRHLRDVLATGPVDDQPLPWRAVRWPAAVLIETLVAENDIEGAWQVAGTHGCNDAVRIDLAERRHRVKLKRGTEPQCHIPATGACLVIHIRRVRGPHDRLNSRAPAIAGCRVILLSVVTR